MKILFIDANIYLRFFDSNQKEFKKLLEELLKIKNDLFITNQIVNEIERNKLSVFEKSINNYKTNKSIESVFLPEHFAMESNSIDILNWNKKRSELENKNLILKKELEIILEENLKSISFSSDSVSLKLKLIFNNKIKESEEELGRSKKRKEIGNPPGKPNDTLGDQISWEQFLSRVETVEEAWIISNDFDYFTLHNKKLYLNAFLYNELLIKNPNIKINCFNTLSGGLASYIKSGFQGNHIKIEELVEIQKEEILLNRISVSSSNIVSIGFDSNFGTLEIEFKNGGVFQYFDVPESIYNGIMSASSHRKYLSQNIKNNYRYSKRS